MDELIKELKEKVSKVNVNGWYFNDCINEFIELASKSKLGDNLDSLLIRHNKITGYIWALYEMQIITGEFRIDLIHLCTDITSQSIFQE